MIHVELLHSLALLITLAVFSGFFRQLWRSGYTGKISQGVLYGLAAIASMLDPMQFLPGVQYDGRSVAISLCGALFGPLPGTVAAVMAGSFRLYLGGAGALTGVLVVVVSAVVGMLFYLRGQRIMSSHPAWTLWGLGITVHSLMIAIQFTLPGGLGWSVLPAVAPGVLVFFPLATILVGIFLLDQSARHRQMAQLSETEDRFRLFLRHTPAAIAMFDKEMNYLAVSDRWYSDYRLSEEDIIGRCHYEVFPEISAEWKSIHQQCLAGESKSRDEERFPRADGGTDRVRWAVIPWHRVDGSVGGLFFFTEVITKRKEAEILLREREQRYRSVFNQHFQYMALLSQEGRVVEINDLALRVGDLEREAVVGKLFWDISWWDELPEVQAQWRSRIRTAESKTAPEPAVVEYRDGSGQLRLADTLVSAVFSEAGDSEYFIVQGRDVTESHRVQQEMESARRLLESTFESMSDVVLVVDVNSRIIVRCNSAVHQVLGYTPEDLTGTGTRILYADDETYRRIGRESRQRLDEGQTFHSALSMVKKDGTTFPVEIAVSAIQADMNWRSGVVNVIRDVTKQRAAESKRRQLENELRQAQKLESVGRLAGGVAHDFNNMLGVILGHTEMALDSVRIDDPLRHPLEEVQQAASRSADLTRQLLAFARRQTIAPTPLDLNETIDSMLKMLGRLVGEDIEIVWNPQPDLPSILADPSQIDQILANLTVNARDAIDGHGVIRIETGAATFDEAHCIRNPGCKPGNFVVLVVSDTGCGMDEGTIAQVFEPFFTTKPQGSGTGLGLATVYGIVEQNSGFLLVDSTPGHGSRFRICLPVHASRNTAIPSKPEVIGSIRGTETILLVEDESSLLELTQRMLERMGYTVLATLSPQDAIASAGTYDGEIQLLITDLIMPEMNGKELKRQVEKLRPSIGTLFISGYTADVIARHGPMDPGVHFLQKPFKAGLLASKVRDAIDAAQGERED